MEMVRNMEVELNGKKLLIRCPYCKSIYQVDVEALKKILNRDQQTLVKWVKGRSQ